MAAVLSAQTAGTPPASSDAPESAGKNEYEQNPWGPLGPPGSRTKETIVDYVKRNSPLGPEGKRALAINLWRSEVSHRENNHYKPQTMTPYPRGDA